MRNQTAVQIYRTHQTSGHETPVTKAHVLYSVNVVSDFPHPAIPTHMLTYGSKYDGTL